MAISHQINLNDNAYRSLNTVKLKKQSYSETIMKLVEDHNELVKLNWRSASHAETYRKSYEVKS